MAEGGVKIRITGYDSGYEKTLKGLEGKTSKILGGVGKAAGIAAKAIGAVSVAAAGVAGTAIQVGMEFDAAMSQVAAVSGAARTELDALLEKASDETAHRAVSLDALAKD